MQWATVLVPLDGSPLAEAALPYAEVIARATGASVELLAVADVEPARVLVVEATPELRSRIEHAVRDPLEAYLDTTATALRGRGLTVATRIVVGEPVDEILAAADEGDTAMIVMATHGRGGAQRWLVGSVADKVMRMSTRPVLLVRPPEAPAARTSVAIRQLVIPLDGSPLAEGALDLAMDLARATGARLILLRVVPFALTLVAPYDASGYVPDISHLDDQVVAAAESYLEDIRSRLPAGMRADTMVLRGPPLMTMLDLLAHDSVDLVVMSTHGWGGLRRLVLGSTADRLVRAGVPVVLVRPSVAPPSATPAPAAQPERHCAACGRLISFAVRGDTRCPRCQMHLHSCPNCVFWDAVACVIQRPEAHDASWLGRGCPRFTFRETVPPERTAGAETTQEVP